MSIQMNDLKILIYMGRKLGEHVAELLAISTPRPEWDEKQCGWRHQIKDGEPQIFLLTKLAGSISTANAMLTLLAQGYWFQAGILARSIREANLSIAFMLPKPGMKVGDWPTKKQKAALDEFFKETWADPARPFKDTSQRSQILLRELSAALGHFSEKNSDISQHDASQAAIQTMRFLSDYTHMAYPRLMELLEAQRGYVLCGQQNGTYAFDTRQVVDVLFDCCNYADCIVVLIILSMVGACEIAESRNEQATTKRLKSKIAKVHDLQKCLESLSKEMEDSLKVSRPDPKKLLREFKKRRIKGDGSNFLAKEGKA